MSLQTTISNFMKTAENSLNGQKTQWEKEKLLVKSDFFFSHSVFKRFILQARKNQGLFGKGFNITTLLFYMFLRNRRYSMAPWGNSIKFLIVLMTITLHYAESINIKVLVRCRQGNSPGACVDLNATDGEPRIWSQKNFSGYVCIYSELPNAGLVIDCSKRGNPTIPGSLPNDTIRLYLNDNNIRKVPKNVFKNLSRLRLLDLSNNSIKNLTQESFEGLQSLRTLNLRNNKIPYTMQAIPAKVFAPVNNLKILHLEQNNQLLLFCEQEQSFPIWALGKLSRLQNLTMDGLNWTFGNVSFSKNFSKLEKLETVEITGHCYIPNITLNMFRHLSQIKHLKINGSCSVGNVENGSFAELKALETLDISSNRNLTLRNLGNISYGLQNTNIQSLDLSAVNKVVGLCYRVCMQDILPLRNTSLKRLYLDSNSLVGFQFQTIAQLPSSLELLSLKDNKITFLFFIYLSFFSDGNLKCLDKLIISDQNKNNIEKILEHGIIPFPRSDYIDVDERTCATTTHKYVPKNSLFVAEPKIQSAFKLCDSCKEGNKTLKIPPNIRYIDLSDMRFRLELHNLCLCKPNNLQKLYLGRNNILSITGTISGVDNLTHFDLSWNSLEYVDSRALHYAPNLLYLNASKNFIGYILEKDNGTIFKNQMKLQTLDISDNKVSRLPRLVFQGLKSITCLFLGNNLIEEFTVDISHMRCLQYLDLSDNYLKTIEDQTAVQIGIVINNRKSDLYIDLSSNRLSCGCKAIKFVEWMSNTNIKFIYQDQYTCTYENGSQIPVKNSNTKLIYEDLSRRCEKYIAMITLTSLIIFCSICVMLGFVLHRYRWDILHMYYSYKVKHNQGGNSTRETDHFNYDAFVSYADTDRAFVKQRLVTALENERGLKLLIHDRDFIAGHFVAENVVNAIVCSRKTLIVMSHQFLKSHWCVYEMNMARIESIQTGRNIVCLLMKEQVALNALPLEIKETIRQKTYLPIPDDEADMEQFWDCLQALITE